MTDQLRGHVASNKYVSVCSHNLGCTCPCYLVFTVLVPLCMRSNVYNVLQEHVVDPFSQPF